MIIAVNWLKKFTDITIPVTDLATLIGARLVEIETTIDLGEKYKDVVVVRVVECAPVEGSDHLNLTKVDDGGVTPAVERDENGLIQVVCGAPNVRSGMLAAWLPAGSIVPETFGGPEPFVLGVRNLRGVASNGMLASAKELDLFDEHTGILAVDKELAPGTHFAAVYELDDYLFDIENKSLTHRPDTFGIIGFAREVAAIADKPFVTPGWLVRGDTEVNENDGSIAAPKVTIDSPELSARYQAVVLSDVDATRETPLEVKTYLARVGVRPINAVVDVTNYLMMLTGQPLHAFDYDKLVAVGGGTADIHVRMGREAETLELLDGRVIELSTEDIVIAAGETAVGLAGAMGGANTVIDVSTKNIILESATFNLYKLRATQMRHGIFSEAITRFTKGQPAALTAPVLAQAVKLLGEWTDAKQVSDIGEATGIDMPLPVITLSVDRINSVLGTTFDADGIEKTLRAIECNVESSTAGLIVTPPYWRGDIHISEDVIEEIGRLHGFDTITLTLPRRDFSAVTPSLFDTFRTKVRHLLVRAGANEVLNYSFEHGDVLKKAGQQVDNSYRITNSISPNLQYYRQTLTPSLLGLIHPNSKQGFDDFAIFEVNKTHPKTRGLTDEDVPVEVDAVALTVTSKKVQAGAAYYRAKQLLDYLVQSFGQTLRYKPMTQDDESLLATPFEYRRSAVVYDNNGVRIGVVGEYKKSVTRAFKLPDYTAGFELETNLVFAMVNNSAPGYTPLSKYPSTERDICFQVPNEVTYGQVIDSAMSILSDVSLETSVSPVDIYQAEDATTKNITIRIRLTSHTRTLTASDVTVVIEGTSRKVIADLGAVLI